jgi:signal transduction histidine kinase
LGLLATLTGCALISILLARGLANPILQMVAFAERVGAGRFGERLATSSPGEIGRLAAALNQMCERLDRQEQERHNFLAAVSHELRTPASNVQVTLESLLAGADGEQALRERFLRAALRESERLSQLVRDLLDLARLEAGGVRMAAHPVRLADLATRAVEAVESRLRERSVLIDMEVPPDYWVTGDHDRLLQVLLNLLDNSIKFAYPETAIRIAADATRQEVELIVEDHGPGIPEEALPFIFDRFYTAEKSRSRPGTRASSGGGTGLGLSVARQIVEAHRGSIDAANLAHGGARFTVRLPRAASPREASRFG